MVKTCSSEEESASLLLSDAIVPRGGGREYRAPYFKYPSPGAVFSKNFKVILFISITLVSPFPWILTEQWWLILIYQFSLSNALQWRSGCLFLFFTVGKVRSKEAKYPWPCDPVQSGPFAVPGWRFLLGSLQRLFAQGTRGAGEKAPHLFVTAHQK